MFPFIHFQIFSKDILIPLYGLCIVAGLFSAAYTGVRLSKKSGQTLENFAIAATCTGFFGFLGAKIMYVLVTFPPSMYLSQLANMQGGYVFYGGLILGPLGLYLGSRLAQSRILDFLNIFACVLPLIHAFGRIGCFCAGCCYGIPYDGLFAVHYHNPITSVTPDIGIFPVQLLESICNFILFAILLIYTIRHLDTISKNFRVCLLYGAGYSVIRFFLEFLRGDSIRGGVGLLSTSQIVSIVLLLLIIIIFVIIKIVERHARMVE